MNFLDQNWKDSVVTYTCNDPYKLYNESDPSNMNSISLELKCLENPEINGKLAWIHKNSDSNQVHILPCAKLCSKDPPLANANMDRNWSLTNWIGDNSTYKCKEGYEFNSTNDDLNTNGEFELICTDDGSTVGWKSILGMQMPPNCIQLSNCDDNTIFTTPNVTVLEINPNKVEATCSDSAGSRFFNESNPEDETLTSMIMECTLDDNNSYVWKSNVDGSTKLLDCVQFCPNDPPNPESKVVQSGSTTHWINSTVVYTCEQKGYGFETSVKNQSYLQNTKSTICTTDESGSTSWSFTDGSSSLSNCTKLPTCPDIQIDKNTMNLSILANDFQTVILKCLDPEMYLTFEFDSKLSEIQFNCNTSHYNWTWSNNYKSLQSIQDLKCESICQEFPMSRSDLMESRMYPNGSLIPNDVYPIFWNGSQVNYKCKWDSTIAYNNLCNGTEWTLVPYKVPFCPKKPKSNIFACKYPFSKLLLPRLPIIQ